MKSINPKAPVKCSLTIVINTTSVDAWNILTNINRWPEWQSEIKKANLNGELKAGSAFKWKSGGVSINSVLHIVEPYSMFGWSGKVLGLHAIHNWKITELNKQVEVSVEESMEGILAKLFKGTFNKSLEKSNRKWLELLQKECERLHPTA